jgi:hypothetical protein
VDVEGIAYTTNNTIQKLLSTPTTTLEDKYSKSGVYKLTFPDCHRNYKGQTDHPSSTRFQEHHRDFTLGHTKSKFAEHLIHHHHSISPMDAVMEPICFMPKGRLMNTVEKFHIHQETKRNTQINDKNTLQPNAFYEDLVHTNLDLDGQHPPVNLSSSTLSTKLYRRSSTFPVSGTTEPFRE